MIFPSKFIVLDIMEVTANQMTDSRSLLNIFELQKHRYDNILLTIYYDKQQLKLHFGMLTTTI